MAEVLGCVEKSELQNLCDKIINNPIPNEENPRYNKNGQLVYCRTKWNKAIEDLCFDKIRTTVENICPQA